MTDDKPWHIQRLDLAIGVMRRYMDWFEDSPEDSWRLQRDMCEALGIEETTQGSNDNG